MQLKKTIYSSKKVSNEDSRNYRICRLKNINIDNCTVFHLHVFFNERSSSLQSSLWNISQPNGILLHVT